MTLPKDPRRPFEPIPLTWAEQQGRLCAEDAFSEATNRIIRERPGDLAYDDFLGAYADAIDLLRLKAEVSREMQILSPGERLLWLHEAVETIIEKARLLFLTSIRHIEERGQFAPGMHENICLVRDFLLRPETRAAVSFDAIIAAR